MVDDKIRRFNALRLEINISYPFPSIVSIFSVFIFIASFSLLGISTYGLGTSVPVGWDSTLITEQLGESIRTMINRATITSILNSFFLVLLVVPLLVAFTFALGFSNGQIRTLLSYPISRKNLILIKSGVVFVLVVSAITSGGLLGMIFFFPFSIDILLLFQLIIPLWITIFLMTVGCVLIATLSQSAPITIAGGVGIWSGAFVLYTMQSTQSIIMSVLIPVLSAINYIDPNPPSPISFMGTTPLSDVLFGSGIALVLGIFLLYLSVFLFRKMEV